MIFVVELLDKIIFLCNELSLGKLMFWISEEQTETERIELTLTKMNR